jgi:hypothetical protein
VVDQTGKPARGKAARNRRPISRHPLFPVIVALWSAALFGVVALAVKPAVLPALIAAAIGGVVGLGIVKRIAATKPPATQAEPAPAPAGEETPLWSDLKTVRQALFDEADGAPAPADPAPVIDRAPTTLDIAEVAMEPLGPVVEPTTLAEPEPAPEPVLDTAAQRIAGADLAELSHVELLERLAISLQRRGHQAVVPDAPVAESSVVFPARAERSGIVPAPQAGPALPAGPHNHGNTEKALRDALTALQRMSGNG